MKPKHTPGPWHLIEDTALSGKRMFHLANKSDYTHGTLQVDKEEGAALIAAAPNLLTALEAFLNDEKDAYEKAHAAIAKAKGESA